MPDKNRDPLIRKLTDEITHMKVYDVVPPMYRLGEGDDTEEIIIEGRRILSWDKVGNEELVAPIARWDVLDYVIDEDEGHLLLPVDTRNARSVLSGMEAWKGEKAAVVNTVIEYFNNLRNELGEEDAGFSWVSVGITPDQHIFIAPPNLAPSNPFNTVDWKEQASIELSLLLQNDTENKHLIRQFAKSLKEKKQDDNF